MLPRRQRAVLVADCIASLWLIGGVLYNSKQLGTLNAATFTALTGARSKGTVLRRSRHVAHCLGPAPHVTQPACAVLYSWLLQHLRMVLSGGEDVATWNTRWVQANRSFLGPCRQTLTALKYLGIDWAGPSAWKFHGRSFNFALSPPLLAKVGRGPVRTLMNSGDVRSILHSARDFLRFV